MTLYVDELMRWAHARGRFKAGSCHMTADSLAELHAFARSIGLSRSRFHNVPRMPHYDLLPAERERALAAGAVFVSWREQAKRRRASRAAAATHADRRRTG